MRTIILFPLAAILIACISDPVPVTSPNYRVPANSHIHLNKTLTILPYSARVYLQYGKVVTPKELDQYYEHCWFLSWKVLETSQTIEPDTFVIIETQQNEDYVKLPTRVQLAAISFRFADTDPGGGPTAIEYLTEFYLHSDKQPDIRRLVCNHWGDPAMGEHLTVAQMQSALGDIAQIKLKQ